MIKDNKSVYDSKKVAKGYEKFDYLLYPEKTIIELIKNKKINNRNVLDIGIGAGRTTKYFAPLFAEYNGIDYAENMIEICKNKFSENKNLKFDVCDARKMNIFSDNTFDFIFFSFNGIDCISIDDRLKVINEVIRVGKNGGHFFFSTHSIYNVPKLFNYQWPKNIFKWPKERKRVLNINKLNKSEQELVKFDIVTIIDGDLDFTAEYVYIKPEFQIEQLRNLGFVNIEAYGLKNQKPIDNYDQFYKINDPWIHFLAEIKK